MKSNGRQCPSRFQLRSIPFQGIFILLLIFIIFQCVSYTFYGYNYTWFSLPQLRNKESRSNASLLKTVIFKDNTFSNNNTNNDSSILTNNNVTSATNLTSASVIISTFVRHKNIDNMTRPPYLYSTRNTPNSNVSTKMDKNSNNDNMTAPYDLRTTVKQSENYNEAVLNSTEMPLCPNISQSLSGPVYVEQYSVPPLRELERKFSSWLKPGGHWSPEHCKVEKKLAIIVPYKCREKHLLLFLQHMHPFLKTQQLDYTMFVVEQDGNLTFNKATIMNIGYVEALKLGDFDCFIFHDIDLLPEDNRNLYTCPEQPRHMSVLVNNAADYKLYQALFGGVTALSKDHFKQLNGFSNSFWGWGAEDDDMSNRIRYHDLYISRYPYGIARYTMLKHRKRVPNPKRQELMLQGLKKFDTDGLSNLKYELITVKQNILYTWILAKLEKPR